MREQKYYDELINGIDEAVEHSMSEVKRFADTYTKEENYYYGKIIRCRHTESKKS